MWISRNTYNELKTDSDQLHEQEVENHDVAYWKKEYELLQRDIPALRKFCKKKIEELDVKKKVNEELSDELISSQLEYKKTTTKLKSMEKKYQELMDSIQED